MFVHEKLREGSFPELDILHTLLFFHKKGICTFEDWKSYSFTAFDELLLSPRANSNKPALKLSVVKLLKKLHYNLSVPSRDL